MSELLKLAERCEQATGPDRELDARIKYALDGRDWDANYGEGYWRDCKALPYTASIDAAMLLVPEGWRWQVESLGIAAVTRGGLQLTAPDPLHAKAPATPALALCAAALKARTMS